VQDAEIPVNFVLTVAYRILGILEGIGGDRSKFMYDCTASVPVEVIEFTAHCNLPVVFSAGILFCNILCNPSQPIDFNHQVTRARQNGQIHLIGTAAELAHGECSSRALTSPLFRWVETDMRSRK
jgi:hypothetical protein